MPVTVVAVLAALALTGVVSARIGGAARAAPSCGSSSAARSGWPLTYGIGHLFGTAIG